VATEYIRNALDTTPNASILSPCSCSTFQSASPSASTALYHLFQKITPANANPPLALIVTYLSAAIICLGLFPFYPLKNGLGAAVRQLNWASVGLEVGFLLAYRSGWNISLAAIVANAAVALILVPLGLLFFKDKVTPINLVGVLVCIVGLVMANLK